MAEKLLIAASTPSHICHFHLPYLRRLREEGWQIHVACGGLPEEIPHADRVISLPLKKRMTSPGNFRASAMLRRIIRQEQYTAVILHTSLASFFCRLALLGLKDRPSVINMVHGYLFDDRTPLPKRLLLLMAEKLTAPVTDLLITMNAYDEALARKHRLGRRIATVDGVGVDFSRLACDRGRDELRREQGIGADAFVLVYPAEFSKRKSQHILLRAMTRLPENTVLVLPGEGKTRNRCRALAKRLKIERRVIFPGYVPEIGAWYKIADAVVSASRTEGLPFIIQEALHLGLPVVASEVKGHIDLIEPDESGLLYPYGDWRACAGCIRKLMQAPLRTRPGADRYSVSNVMPRVMELYRSGIIR